jgi:hypothetical protein
MRKLAILLVLSCVPVVSAQGVADRGDFVLEYKAPKDAKYRRFQQLLRESGYLEESLRDLNAEISLPRNVSVVVEQCGEANAFYDSEDREISVCYELAESFEAYLKDDADSPAQLKDYVATATDWILHHEVGHALRDVLDLPVVGKEEDAVDDLATLIYIRGGDSEAALVAADSFFDEGVEEVESLEDVEELPFWDEHSLSLQRYYSIVCLVIGSDPEAHADVAKEVPELEDRDCEAEYELKDAAWERLLGKNLKPAADDDEDDED